MIDFILSNQFDGRISVGRSFGAFWKEKLHWNRRRDWQIEIEWILPQFIWSDLILSCEKNSFFVRFEKINYIEIQEEIDIPKLYLISRTSQTLSYHEKFPNIILSQELPKPIELNFRSFEKNWQYKINERSQRTKIATLFFLKPVYSTRISTENSPN